MKPVNFEFVAAEEVAEASTALLDDEEAQLIAGGQSLVPLMNLRVARPALLVDLNGVKELDVLETGNGAVTIGALCRHRRLELDDLIGDRAPLLKMAAQHIGHVQIRNRGTLGGSIAHADPVGELPTAVVALDATVHLGGRNGERSVPATSFFTGFFSTAIERGEVITKVTVPRAAPGDGFCFTEFAPRLGDFAIVGAATWLTLDSDGSCRRARAAASGVASTPLDLSSALEGLVGSREPDDGRLRGTLELAASMTDPIGDVHASAEDRKELLQLLLGEAIRGAFADSRERAA
jgi:carbon-monoxide dehydrogenase medium subunit